MADQHMKRMFVILFRTAYIGAAVILVLIIVSDIASGFLHHRKVYPNYSERHMGTLFQITIAGDEQTGKDAAAKAFARAKELDDKLSDYKPDSELMRLCAKAGQGPIAVSDDLFNVMSEAQRIAKLSDGAFDVTVGPIVRLWRLARRTREMPPDDELKAALAKVGYDKVRLDGDKKTISLAESGMKLDLGGVAKGFAAEEMIKVLREAGCSRSLVAAGGDIMAGDAPPGEAGWTVTIAPLDTTDMPPTQYVANAAISTSGGAEQFVEIDGKRYAHIVDPKTGVGLMGQFTVTVRAKTGAAADALATAAAVMGAERGIKMIDGLTEASARFAWKEPGKFRTLVRGSLKN
jgi:FAD:protein FMN transferase